MADVYQGSFEWRRTGTDDYKIALFKFDTITGFGAVAELKPDQGAYANPGFWRFRLGIKDRNIHSDKIIVSSLEDLVNFATKQIIVMPQPEFLIHYVSPSADAKCWSSVSQ